MYNSNKFLLTHYKRDKCWHCRWTFLRDSLVKFLFFIIRSLIHKQQICITFCEFEKIFSIFATSHSENQTYFLSKNYKQSLDNFDSVLTDCSVQRSALPQRLQRSALYQRCPGQRSAGQKESILSGVQKICWSESFKLFSFSLNSSFIVSNLESIFPSFFPSNFFIFCFHSMRGFFILQNWVWHISL